MSRGTVDVFTSRRINYVKCLYWIAGDDINGPIINYESNQNYDGFFYGREVTAETHEYMAISNEFLAPKKTITLYTEDDVKDLTENSIIEYDGEIWRVDNVQKTKKKRQNQYSYSPASVYYISMRR